MRRFRMGQHLSHLRRGGALMLYVYYFFEIHFVVFFEKTIEKIFAARSRRRPCGARHSLATKFFSMVGLLFFVVLSCFVLYVKPEHGNYYKDRTSRTD